MKRPSWWTAEDEAALFTYARAHGGGDLDTDYLKGAITVGAEWALARAAERESAPMAGPEEPSEPSVVVHMPPEYLKALDSVRGHLSRERFLLALLEREINGVSYVMPTGKVRP